MPPPPAPPSTAASAARSAALSLYRGILRAHARHLPEQMRELGDAYVRSEFRLHRTATGQEHVRQFHEEWGRYQAQIEETGRARTARAAGGLGDGGGGGLGAAGTGTGTGMAAAVEGEPFLFGSDMPPDVELSDEQRVQIEKLREEARKAARGQ